MSEYVVPSVRTFLVFPDLPEALLPLLEMARNFWWVWQPDAVKMFRRLDRKLWEDVYHNLWPQVPPDDVPIKYVTNGIHVRSWLSADMAFMLDRYLGDNWFDDPADSSVWEGVSQIPDEELWRAHE